ATGCATRSIVLLLIAVPTLALAVWLRWRGIEEAPGRVNDDDKSDVALPFVPHTPAGIQCERSLRYVCRDNRLLLSVLVRPIVVIVLMVQSTAQGIPEISYIAVVMSALLAGSIAVNDFGYDGPAMWVKMVAPVPTSRLLLARHWAHMSLSALVTVVFAIIILVIHGITSVT